MTMRLIGPDWVSLHDVAQIFDLSTLMAGRLRTEGLLHGHEVFCRVYRFRLMDVEHIGMIGTSSRWLRLGSARRR
jgi:hypothetical protein